MTSGGNKQGSDTWVDKLGKMASVRASARTSSLPPTKTLAKLLLDFNVNDWEMDGGEISRVMENLRPERVGRTPEEIDQENETKFLSAIGGVQIGFTGEDKPVLEYNAVKPVSADRIPDEVGKVVIQRMNTHLCAYAFVYGNYNEKRFWIRIGREIGEDNKPTGKHMYFGLPSLMSTGNHSVLVHHYRDYISALLRSGAKNSLRVVLEKAGVDIANVSYLFPKGHTLLTNMDDIKLCRADLELIFDQLKKPVEGRDFTNLKFFSKKGLTSTLFTV